MLQLEIELEQLKRIPGESDWVFSLLFLLNTHSIIPMIGYDTEFHSNLDSKEKRQLSLSTRSNND